MVRYSLSCMTLSFTPPRRFIPTHHEVSPRSSTLKGKVKTMASHSSAGLREHTSHVNQTTRTSTIVNALKRRAQAVLNDKSIDAQSRAIIRYALETNDPWLAELVRRADMGDTTEQLDFSQMPENNEDDSSDAKIEACVELICNAGSKASVALLVLMATLEKATHPKALANVAKHLVFTCCTEANVNGMVDAHIAQLEDELLRE